MLNPSLSKALRDSQLLTSRLQSEAVRQVRGASSASTTLQRAADTPLSGADDGQDKSKRELETLAKRLFILCSPWPIWKTSGAFITELTESSDSDLNKLSPEVITENDVIGERILSEFVPEHLREVFLSSGGQEIVSYSRLLPLGPTLIQNI